MLSANTTTTNYNINTSSTTVLNIGVYKEVLQSLKQLVNQVVNLAEDTEAVQNDEEEHKIKLQAPPSVEREGGREEREGNGVKVVVATPARAPAITIIDLHIRLLTTTLWQHTMVKEKELLG